MALDPHMKAFVDQALAAGMPPDFRAVGAVAAREQSAAAGAMMGTGPEMAKVSDVVAPLPSAPLPARLYIPNGRLSALIVFYHGGGWVLGDIAAYDAPARRLAMASHCAVLSVAYRLAPEHAFPTTVEDCYAALKWAADQVPQLTGEALPLAVAGDSAGGNLAAVVALMARDRHGPKIALQCLIYPVTDADFTTPSYREFATGYLLTADAMRWFWDQYVPDTARRSDPMASPLRATSLAGLPAAMVETAGIDALRDEGESYAQALKKAGVKATLRRWDGLVHGFFQFAMILPPAGEAVDRMGTDIDAFFSSLRGAGP